MKKINILFAGVALVAGLSFASCAGTGTESQENAADTVAVTEEEPVNEVHGFVTYLNEDKFDTKCDQLTIIDFNATWCGPCQKFTPIFHNTARKYRDNVKFVAVDVDACPEVAAQFGVSSIPQITYIKPDGTIDSHVGLMTEEEFDAAIKAHLQ